MRASDEPEAPVGVVEGRVSTRRDIPRLTRCELQERRQTRHRVFRRTGSAKLRWTINLRAFLARRPDAEQLAILAKFDECLGPQWEINARQPLPKTRAECPQMRPCRLILCPRHLAVESTFRASLRLVHPSQKIEDLDYTCMWDWIAAHPDGATLGDVGRTLGLSRVGAHWSCAQAISKVERQWGPDWIDKLRSKTPEESMSDEKPSERIRTRYPIHPAAELLPQLTTEERRQIKEDIRRHGQRERIVLYEDQIIDGRNRYEICNELGIPPLFTSWDGKGSSPAEYVLSLNLRRRHLTTSQRAMAASKLEALIRQEKAQGEAGWAEMPNEQVSERARARAADKLAVSDRIVGTANVVRDHGIPDLVRAVEVQGLTVSAAAAIARLPEEQQRRALAGLQPAAAPQPRSIRMRRREAREVRIHVADAKIALATLSQDIRNRQVLAAIATAEAVAASMQATLRKLRCIQREAAVRGEARA